MSPRTRYLSRLIGLYCLLVGLSMIVHKQTTVESITETVHHAPAVLLSSIFALAAGLAIVIGHNVWSGGVPAVLVTLVGWITLIKGLLLLFLTPQATVGFFEAAHYGQMFYLYVAITLVLGIALTYGGFKPASH